MSWHPSPEMNGPRGQALADNITIEEVFEMVDNASLKWNGQALLITSRNGPFKCFLTHRNR